MSWNAVRKGVDLSGLSIMSRGETDLRITLLVLYYIVRTLNVIHKPGMKYHAQKCIYICLWNRNINVHDN